MSVCLCIIFDSFDLASILRVATGDIQAVNEGERVSLLEEKYFDCFYVNIIFVADFLRLFIRIWRIPLRLFHRSIM